jgi:hypothetical protein
MSSAICTATPRSSISVTTPAGFDGNEDGSWGSYGYKRACTGGEAVLLDASVALDKVEERADDEADRDSYFADLAAEVAAEELEISIGVTPAPEPGPAFPCENQANPGSSPG